MNQVSVTMIFFCPYRNELTIIEGKEKRKKNIIQITKTNEF